MWNYILLIHPTTGVFAILCAVWLLTECYHVNDGNIARIRLAARLVALLIVLTWVAGGVFYVLHYAVDKAVILKGPWPFAHDFFMETKEHMFFIVLILALFLPFAVKSDLVNSRGARNVVRATAALVIVFGLAMEGAGSMINLGVKVGLTSPAAANTIQMEK